MAIVLALAVTSVLQLIGYKAAQLTGEIAFINYITVAFSLVPFVVFLLNLPIKKKSKKKASPVSEKEKYERQLELRKRINENYDRESKKVLFRFALVDILFALNVLIAALTAFLSAYYYVAYFASILVLYDAFKRIMPYPLIKMKDVSTPLDEHELKEIDRIVSKCAEDMHCKKPTLYGEFCERIMIKDNNRLVLGTHILPHLTEQQLSAIICREMALNKSVSRTVQFKKIKNPVFLGSGSFFSVKGGELYKKMTECSEFTDYAIYTEELEADRKAAQVCGADTVISALAVETTYRDFLNMSDPRTLRLLQTVPQKCSAVGDEFSELFKEYINTRPSRIASMLESKLSDPYDNYPTLARRAEMLGCSIPSVTENKGDRISNDIKKLTQYVEGKTDEFLKTCDLSKKNDAYIKNINLINEYEKREGEIKYTEHKLVRIARAYAKVGRPEKAKELLSGCLESEDEMVSAAAHYYFGKTLLDQDDSDGIKYIDRSVEISKKFAYGYYDVCKFAARFGMDKVLKRYTELYFDSGEDNDDLENFMNKINKDSPIFPSQIASETLTEIGSTVAGLGNGAVHSVYTVRVKYGKAEQKETNLVLVILEPTLNGKGYTEIKEDIHAYLNSRPETFSLLCKERIPAYVYLFLSKVPDCTVYRKK